MREVVSGTGGQYFAMSDQSAIKGIVDSVQAQEATLIDAASAVAPLRQPDAADHARRGRARRGHRREPEVVVVSSCPSRRGRVLLVLVVAALAAVWWNPSSRSVPGESRSTHWRLTAAVVLLGVGGPAPGRARGAGRHDGRQPQRLLRRRHDEQHHRGGLRQRAAARSRGSPSDISAIAERAARRALLGRHVRPGARVRLPLTTDTTALDAAVETLLPESYEVSRGTSVSEANDRLKALLQQADARTPERGRIVFYFGDGEQTAAEAPAPFAIDQRLVNGGAVLGYGTTEGGRMKATRSRFDTSRDYIKDPATGEDARSVISEDTLRTIADQLGLPYVHREAGDAIGPVVDGIDLERFGTSDADREAEGPAPGASSTGRSSSGSPASRPGRWAPASRRWSRPADARMARP